MPLGQSLDCFRVYAKRDDKRMFAASLQRVCMAGLQEDDATFGKGFGVIRQVVSNSSVLYPKKLKKVVIMQLFRSRGR